ncbi:MAG: hypothetical protein ACJA2S_002559 [Cyclobacteriaceae bacterium]|jgi:hypothetical protein
MDKESVFKSKIGFGRRDITPPNGIYSRCWGVSKSDCAKGIHKQLYATAMVMASGNEPENFYVLVNFDGTLYASKEDEWEMRKAVIDALGTNDAQVMIGVSHTHSVMFLSRDNANKPGGELVVPYLNKIKEQIVKAVLEARKNLKEASINWFKGSCDLAANRDLKVSNSNKYITGYNPEVTADETLVVGKVTSSNGDVLGILVNYACHPTTLGWENELISPDYVGAMRETIEEQYPKALCLFLLGACGELAPAHQYTGDTDIADLHGKKLGFSVLSVLQGLSQSDELAFDKIQESGAPLAVWTLKKNKAYSEILKSKVEQVPIKIKPDWQDHAQIKRELEQATDRVIQERLLRKLRVQQSLGDTNNFHLPVWIWRVGKAFFIGSQAEAYSILQIELRKAFPNSTIIVMNLINGANGYLPESHLYTEDIYTVWQTPFDKGGLEILIDTCKKAIRSMS